MAEHAFDSCPRCGNALQAGFAHRATGLSFVQPEKLEQFLLLDEDLAQSGLRRLLPWRAEYFRSYLCRGCKLYLIDFSTILSKFQAKEIALSLAGPA